MRPLWFNVLWTIDQQKVLKSLQALVQLLEQHSLKEAEDAVYNVLQILAGLIRLEPETFHGDFSDDL